MDKPTILNSTNTDLRQTPYLAQKARPIKAHLHETIYRIAHLLLRDIAMSPAYTQFPDELQ